MAKRFRFFLISDFPFYLYYHYVRLIPFLFFLFLYSSLSPFLELPALWARFTMPLFFRVGVGRVGWMDGYLLEP